MATTRTKLGGRQSAAFPVPAVWVTSFTVAGYTDWMPIVGPSFLIEVTGTATAIAINAFRSAIDPTGGALGVPADSNQIAGNPSTGMSPTEYSEPGLGWWRFQVVSMTGAAAQLAVSGKALDSAA
jgi:hypothetical protein